MRCYRLHGPYDPHPEALPVHARDPLHQPDRRPRAARSDRGGQRVVSRRGWCTSRPGSSGCRRSGSTTATSPGSSRRGRATRGGPAAPLPIWPGATSAAWVAWSRRRSRPAGALAAELSEAGIAERHPRPARREPGAVHPCPPSPRRGYPAPLRPARGAARAVRRPDGGGEGARPAARRLAGGGAPHRRPAGRSWGWARPAGASSGAAASDARLWLPFEADRDRLADLYAAAELVVAPCPIETFGLAALEALASGAPVLAADRGGVAETVERSGGGRHFASGDARQPSPRRRSPCSRATWPRSARRGRRYAAAHHGWDGVLRPALRRIPASSPAREPAGLDSRRDPGARDRRSSGCGRSAPSAASFPRSWWFPTGMANGLSSAIPSSSRWLRERAADGRGDRAPRRAARRGGTCRARRPTASGPGAAPAREGEFLDARTWPAARERIERGAALLRALGLRPIGFVPPAWLAREDGHRAAARRGSASARTRPRDSLLSRRAGGSVGRRCAGARARRAGLGLGGGGPGTLDAAARARRYPRIAFHPQDLDHPAAAADARAHAGALARPPPADLLRGAAPPGLPRRPRAAHDGRAGAPDLPRAWWRPICWRAPGGSSGSSRGSAIRIRFWDSFVLNAFGDAACALTPLRIGGEPARLAGMLRSRVPATGRVRRASASRCWPPGR